MKFVIQRVTQADVQVDGKVIGKIGKGFVVLIGVGPDDTRETADRYLRKMIGLRIFDDENGKTNTAKTGLSNDEPGMAKELYEYIVAEAGKAVPSVQTGSFGADMKVSLVNDGPFTVILENL